MRVTQKQQGQCSALVPDNWEFLSVRDAGDAGDPVSNVDRRRKSEADELDSYNAQLGTQYAHSPSTGQVYLLDRAASWNDHGPDGPGYYRPVGNSYEKLVPGMQ